MFSLTMIRTFALGVALALGFAGQTVFAGGASCVDLLTRQPLTLVTEPITKIGSQLIIELRNDPLEVSKTELRAPTYSLKSIHHYLYRGPISVKAREPFITRYYIPRADLQRAMKPGMIYTFALMRDSFRLSPFDGTAVSNFLSKHVLLTSHQDTVYAAEIGMDSKGEFHVSRASGTYKPSADGLQKFVEAMRIEFPDYIFHAHDSFTPMDQILMEVEKTRGSLQVEAQAS